jgi:hypothetical protein
MRKGEDSGALEPGKKDHSVARGAARKQANDGRWCAAREASFQTKGNTCDPPTLGLHANQSASMHACRSG